MNEDFQGTSLSAVYQAFLAKITADDWDAWTLEEAKKDWKVLLDGAITWFKFPRVELEHNGSNFKANLDNEEIQILANYMVCEWLSRTVRDWQNIKPLYDERDFSQANMLAKLESMLASERADALRRESLYYRSIKRQPFDYRSLADNS